MDKNFKFRRYQKGDERDLVKLHRELFNSKMTLSYWNWKYKECPLGFEVYLALDNKNNLIGMYGNQFKKGIYNKKECKILNIVDVCVHKDFRGGFLFNAANLNKKNKDIFSINFPREYLIDYLSKHPLTYNIMSIPIISKKIFPNDINHSNKFNFIKINNFNKFIINELDSFWNIKSKELNSSVIRDSSYIKWRIFDSPDNIKVFLIKYNQKTIGYFAILIRNDKGYIADFVVFNKFFSLDLVKELEKICLSININELYMLSNDLLLNKTLINYGYLYYGKRKAIIINNMKNKIKNLNIFVSFSDADEF